MKKLSLIMLALMVVLSGVLAGCSRPSSPATTPTPSHSSVEEVEVKDATTDSAGQVSFIDNSTGEEVKIKVVDSSQSPLKNIEVTYSDGEGYEVFTTYDASSEYLPAIGVYAHNSDHIIETKRAGRGSYQIFVFEDEESQKAVWKWKHDNGMDWGSYTYVRTINYEEKVKMQEWLGKLNDFLFGAIL